MFTALTTEQKAHWGYLQSLHHTAAIAGLSAAFGRQRIAQLDKTLSRLNCNEEFEQALESARSINMHELTRMQAREWQRIAHAQPWLLQVDELEPYALEVLEWPVKGGA